MLHLKSIKYKLVNITTQMYTCIQLTDLTPRSIMLDFPTEFPENCLLVNNALVMLNKGYLFLHDDATAVRSLFYFLSHGPEQFIVQYTW